MNFFNELFRAVFLCTIILGVYAVSIIVEHNLKKKEETRIRETGKYSIQYPLSYRLLGLIAFLFFLWLTIVNVECVYYDRNTLLWTEIEGADNTTIVFFAIFTLLGFCVMCITLLRRMKIDGNTVKCRNFIGITRTYDINDMWCEQHNTKLGTDDYVYYGDKKVFTIDLLMKNGGFFWEQTFEKSIEKTLERR